MQPDLEKTATFFIEDAPIRVNRYANLSTSVNSKKNDISPFKQARVKSEMTELDTPYRVFSSQLDQRVTVERRLRNVLTPNRDYPSQTRSDMKSKAFPDVFISHARGFRVKSGAAKLRDQFSQQPRIQQQKPDVSLYDINMPKFGLPNFQRFLQFGPQKKMLDRLFK